MKITFLGATGTVTGSKYLVEAGGKRLLVDCGLFQGYKQLRLRNWAPPPVDPHEIDAVLLTHAHIDHSGYFPVLAKCGFRGPLWCTEAARDLAAILLPDAGHLQEEETAYLNRHGKSRSPGMPPPARASHVRWRSSLPATRGASLRRSARHRAACASRPPDGSRTTSWPRAAGA